MSDPQRYDEFVELIGIHTNRLLAYIDALLLNRADAEDVFQETCLVLWQKFDEFAPGSNFLAWALRIADFKAANFQRTRARRVAFTSDLRDAMMAAVARRQAEASVANVETLAKCMDGLADADRTMVTRCYAEGESVRQVADALGRSTQSIHHSLRRIRISLLDCIRREMRRQDVPGAAARDVLREESGP
jgi:RNA polymerase sigma-70 factor (ECF subfamily)